MRKTKRLNRESAYRYRLRVCASRVRISNNFRYLSKHTVFFFAAVGEAEVLQFISSVKKIHMFLMSIKTYLFGCRFFSYWGLGSGDFLSYGGFGRRNLLGGRCLLGSRGLFGRGADIQYGIFFVIVRVGEIIVRGAHIQDSIAWGEIIVEERKTLVVLTVE
jgi:hypothetical protein